MDCEKTDWGERMKSMKTKQKKSKSKRTVTDLHYRRMGKIDDSLDAIFGEEKRMPHPFRASYPRYDRERESA